MISEFSVSPRPSNNKARHLFFILIILAVTAAAIYLTLTTYRSIVGLVCLVLLVGAIYIYNRYMATKYYYDVMVDTAGTPLFVVRSVVGKRATTLCRVELSSIIGITTLTAEERKNHKTPDGFVKYFYSPTMSPDRITLITVSSRYERAEISIEASDELVQLLTSYVKEAREFHAEEE